MRLYLKILLVSFLFVACNDGEIVVTTFDFADTNISSCNNTGTTKLLYKAKTDPINEALILSLSNATFSETGNVLIDSEITTPRIINLSSTGDNQLIYRTFDAAATNAYFCSDIPQSTPKVIQEYISEGGKVNITTLATVVEDTDGDGIKDADEKTGDSDGDGIDDIYDIDDDGDTVLTKIEIAVNAENEFDGLPDSDNDGIPNYLDPDDDGDSTLTKYEITSLDQKPDQNAVNNGDPAYLVKEVNLKFDGEPLPLPNIIQVKYSSLIVINNLVLKDRFSNGEEIKFEGPFQFGTFNSGQQPVTINPTPEPTEDN